MVTGHARVMLKVSNISFCVFCECENVTSLFEWQYLYTVKRYIKIVTNG
jgi:hypothetical protein